jgi:hypothetical protein
MTITEKENELFNRWKNEMALSFNADGIINLKIWGKTSPKIMFVLKETNALKGDLRHFLASGGSDTYYRTWNNVVRWTEVVLCDTYSEHIDDERRTKILSHVCAVNLKKECGGAKSKKSEIQFAARRDSEFIKEQMSLYLPDLVITCGFGLVGDTLRDIIYNEKNSEWKHDINELYYYKSVEINKNKPIYVISMPHPNRASKTKWCEQLRELYNHLSGNN